MGKRRVNGQPTEFELQVNPGRYRRMRIKTSYLGIPRETTKTVWDK